MKKWFEEGNYVEWNINEDEYYCTGKDGYGLFLVNSAANSRKQILGTCEFSVVGIKDKKGKVRKAIKGMWA